MDTDAFLQGATGQFKYSEMVNVGVIPRRKFYMNFSSKSLLIKINFNFFI